MTEKEPEGPSSPLVGPPATGERDDREQTVPGVKLPNAPERREAPLDEKPGTEAPDEGAAREREDDLR